MFPFRIAVSVALLFTFSLIVTGYVCSAPSDLEATMAVHFEPAQAVPPQVAAVDAPLHSAWLAVGAPKTR